MVLERYLLELGRRQVAERRVTTVRVVPALDVVEDGEPGVGLGVEASAVEQLASRGVAKKLSAMALS